MFNTIELIVSIDRGLYELCTDNNTSAAALLIALFQRIV